jgi:hypothetical protein
MPRYRARPNESDLVILARQPEPDWREPPDVAASEQAREGGLTMPPEPTGTLYRTASGWGIRWPEQGRRHRKPGFKTKREARQWFAAHVAPRLRTGAPSPELPFDDFCDLFLERHGASVSPRTKATLEERLAPARDHFGGWTLRELERAADDVAAWRALAQRVEQVPHDIRVAPGPCRR